MKGTLKRIGKMKLRRIEGVFHEKQKEKKSFSQIISLLTVIITIQSLPAFTMLPDLDHIDHSGTYLVVNNEP